MAYGAPTNLDLSACNVTATGGSTVQTLADLGKAVADNATGVSNAQDAAATAQTNAASAAATAATAQTNATAAAASAATALTTAQEATSAIEGLGNTYIPQSAYGTKNGVLQLDANHQFITPPTNGGYTTLYLGGYKLNADGTTSTDTSCIEVTSIYTVTDANSGKTNSGKETFWTSGSANGIYRAFGMLAFHAAADGSSDLGLASNAWGNIYSKTAVQVTSDATQKTVIGSLGDANYADGQKLASALFDLDTAMFQLNASIAAKGAANARLHAGFIAQQVEAAIAAAGLDPAKYALWTNSPVYETTQVDTGEKDSAGNPITKRTVTLKKDAQGNQVYTQMLRYEQILCVLFEACKAKIAAQNTALAAANAHISAHDTALASLNARIAVLETKIAAMGGAA